MRGLRQPESAGREPVSRVGLISDPHGDVEALRSAIRCIRSIHVDEVWCLGDVVGDGDSEAALSLALCECDVVIAGNHDQVIARRLTPEIERAHDREGSIDRIRGSLSEHAMALLRSLPLQHLSADMQACHAALDHPFAHVEDEYDASSQLALSDRPILAFGHAHKAFCYLSDGRWFVRPQGQIELTPRAVVCPGTVRGFADHKGTVCVVDTVSRTCSWLEVPSA